jgi:glycosyltransferase involved in cell wall biosynthesis
VFAVAEAGGPRLAIVHDWLTGMRGGEKVLEGLCDLYPDADIFTLLHVRGSVSPRIERHRIITSFVQHLPYAARRYRHYLPLFPLAVRLLNLDGYDVVISVSHCAAKSVIVKEPTRHLCYCLTPMRYAWDQFDAYFGTDRVGWAGRAVLRPILGWLARWDAATAARAHRFVAISSYVAARIAKYYNRQASVVYPPVDTDYFVPGEAVRGSHALVVSALVPYKRLDVAIEACQLAGVPLSIAGDGPELERLRRMAGPSVSFLGRVSDEEIRRQYRTAGVVLLPGVEDFGIVPLEAQACGTPVVAIADGGALETVVEGVTGTLVEGGSPAALAAGIVRTLSAEFDRATIRAHAVRFGRDRFLTEIRASVDDLLQTA